MSVPRDSDAADAVVETASASADPGLQASPDDAVVSADAGEASADPAPTCQRSKRRPRFVL